MLGLGVEPRTSCMYCGSCWSISETDAAVGLAALAIGVGFDGAVVFGRCDACGRWEPIRWTPDTP